MVGFALLAWFEDPAAAPAGNMLSMLLPFALMMAAMYFLMIAPERKRSREQKAMLDALKKNDRVVTMSGIHGVVTNPKPGEDTVHLRIDDEHDVKIVVARSSIARVLNGPKAN
jgi:preprotein translocase subunit YajC